MTALSVVVLLHQRKQFSFIAGKKQQSWSARITNYLLCQHHFHFVLFTKDRHENGKTQSEKCHCRALSSSHMGTWTIYVPAKTHYLLCSNKNKESKRSGINAIYLSLIFFSFFCWVPAFHLETGGSVECEAY